MKYRLILFVVLSVFLFGGCSRFISDIAEGLENSQSAVGGEMGLEIIRCFNEHDSEALKEMFCPLIKSTHDLDTEIEEAFKIIDKPILSREKFLIGGEEHIREGEIAYSHIGVSINNVVLSEDEKYDIFYAAYLVNKNENTIGLTCIDIYNSDDELICSIGEQF